MYVVAVRWVSGIWQGEKVDAALTPFGDWHRYNGHTWLVWTDQPPIAITTAVRAVLPSSESVLTLRLDTSAIDGWAPQMTWDWIHSKTTQNAMLMSSLLKNK
jgi:hypothetical protein